MYKKVILFIVVVSLGYLGYKFIIPKHSDKSITSNHQVRASDNTTTRQDQESVINKLLEKIGTRDTAKSINNYISYTMAGNGPDSNKILASTNDYLKYRLEALNAQDPKQIALDYKQAFFAMACAHMYLKNNHQDAYSLFKNLDQIIMNDNNLRTRQEKINTALSGEVFIDLTPEEKTIQCAKTY
jgi:hypothetical protein